MKNEISIDRRAVLVLGGAAFVLSACSNIIGPPEAPKIYVLRPGLPPPTRTGPRTAWSLAIATPNAPQNLDTDRIAISRSADTEDYYADAVWQDRLPNVVQGALVDAFEGSAALDQVMRDADGVRSDYLLQVDIKDFEARYDQPDGAPTAVVAMEAKLVNRADRVLVAHVSVKQESAAAQNSIEEAVQAMDRALGAALADIVRWAPAAVPTKPAAHGKRNRH